jgi:Tol biopolymer transport system component
MWIISLIAAALVISAFAQKSAEVALRAAMETETVKGDLKGAIEQYKKIAQSGDRALAAQALVHMAECYQKLGNSESRKIYEQIVREYADQKEAVTVARAKLGAAAGTGPSGALATRPQCQECKMDGAYGSNISADGRWLAFIRANSDDLDDLEIADLATNQIKHLIAGDSAGHADSAVVSPGGREIAFAWTKDDEIHKQLRVMAIDSGAKPRVVLESNPEIGYPAPLGWSADGKSLLEVHRKGDSTWQLEWVPVAGGEVKVLKSLQWRVTQDDSVDPKLSPDGRYIAYAALAVNPKSYVDKTGSTDQHIYVLAADGSSETEVVKTSGTNRSPVWTPDGKHLLFISDRSGSPALWSVAIEDGKASGVPSLVTSDLGNGRVASKAVTRSGSYQYVLEQEGLEQIFISAIDPAGRKIDRGTRGSLAGTSPAWSPDGKSLAFKRRHHVNDYSVDQSSYDLVVHSLETGDERTFPTALGFTGGGQPQWFNDGKAILTGLEGSRPRNPGFYRVDLASGEWKEVSVAMTALSPDDKTRYGFFSDGTVRAYDLATGTQRQIFSTHPTLLRGLRLSPDRRTLAIQYGDLPGPRSHLGTVGVEDGKFRELLALPARLDALGWTNDSQTILFGQRNLGDKTRIMRMPSQGGTPEFTGIEAEGWIGSMDISPDGSRIAFNAKMYPPSELWSLDNVLSALK